MRILIAEDDAVSRLILQKAIEKLGHEALVAADGAAAWALFQRAPVEVVISDWMMPELDGPALCARIRAHVSDAYPYFIFLTALSDKAHVLIGMESGADDYLTKPLDRDELRVKLIAAERITALHRQLAAHKADLERLNQQLYTQARRDPLTGLANRLQLDEDLEILRGRGERYGHSYALALCDVDHFKWYNDHYGHPAGDTVLRRVAHAISAQCRSGDAAYRYGGEEFLLILPEQSLAQAVHVMERLRQEVEGLAISHAGNELAGMVTVSAGVSAPEPGTSTSVEAVLREADANLYRAKGAGRNRVAAGSGISSSWR